MGNNSSEAGQTITLPKGGGALHGIGEKFSPDLHTGTGNFTIPIAIPPGRNGFQPQLNLVYSTGNGEGISQHRRHREFRFDIAANQIKHDGKKGHNPERIPWFAERAARHQWAVPQLVPY